MDYISYSEIAHFKFLNYLTPGVTKMPYFLLCNNGHATFLIVTFTFY